MSKIKLLDETRQASAGVYKAIDKAADEIYEWQRKIPEMMVSSLLHYALFAHEYFKNILDVIEAPNSSLDASALALQTIPLELLQEVSEKARAVLARDLERGVLETASLFQGPARQPSEYQEPDGLKELNDFFSSFDKMYHSYCMKNLEV